MESLRYANLCQELSECLRSIFSMVEDVTNRLRRESDAHEAELRESENKRSNIIRILEEKVKTATELQKSNLISRDGSEVKIDEGAKKTLEELEAELSDDRSVVSYYEDNFLSIFSILNQNVYNLIIQAGVIGKFIDLDQNFLDQSTIAPLDVDLSLSYLYSKILWRLKDDAQMKNCGILYDYYEDKFNSKSLTPICDLSTSLHSKINSHVSFVVFYGQQALSSISTFTNLLALSKNNVFIPIPKKSKIIISNFLLSRPVKETTCKLLNQNDKDYLLYVKAALIKASLTKIPDMSHGLTIPNCFIYLNYDKYKQNARFSLTCIAITMLHELCHFIKRISCSTIRTAVNLSTPEMNEGGKLAEIAVFGKTISWISVKASSYMEEVNGNIDIETFLNLCGEKPEDPKPELGIIYSRQNYFRSCNKSALHLDKFPDISEFE